MLSVRSPSCSQRCPACTSAPTASYTLSYIINLCVTSRTSYISCIYPTHVMCKPIIYNMLLQHNMMTNDMILYVSTSEARSGRLGP